MKRSAGFAGLAALAAATLSALGLLLSNVDKHGGASATDPLSRACVSAQALAEMSACYRDADLPLREVLVTDATCVDPLDQTRLDCSADLAGLQAEIRRAIEMHGGDILVHDDIPTDVPPPLLTPSPSPVP